MTVQYVVAPPSLPPSSPSSFVLAYSVYCGAISSTNRSRPLIYISTQFATSRVEIAEAREKRSRSDADCINGSNNDHESCPPGEIPTWSRICRDSKLPARGETPLLMLDRWRKLHDELYDSGTGFDITKVGDFLLL